MTNPNRGAERKRLFKCFITTTHIPNKFSPKARGENNKDVIVERNEMTNVFMCALSFFWNFQDEAWSATKLAIHEGLKPSYKGYLPSQLLYKMKDPNDFVPTTQCKTNPFASPPAVVEKIAEETGE